MATRVTQAQRLQSAKAKTYTLEQVEAMTKVAHADSQFETVRALSDAGGNVGDAAEIAGITPEVLYKRSLRLMQKAYEGGWHHDSRLDHGSVRGGQIITGDSILYDEDGNVKLHWQKTSRKPKDMSPEQFAEVMEGILEPFKGAGGKSKTAARAARDPKTMTCYPIGDMHVGMYAWAEETGEDFDTQIAERFLSSAIDQLVDAAPPSNLAVVFNVGDFFHSDSEDNRTKRSGNALDVDTRWMNVLRVGVRMMRYVIDRALTKHKVVGVVNVPGNHDDHTAHMLSLLLDAFYSKEPRVWVDSPEGPTANPLKYVRFGKVLIGTTHGDMAKPDKLGQIMAADRPFDWGDTEHRYWYTGHIHQTTKLETPGCVVETFRTLASKDAWHNRMGYRSGQDMYAIVHHVDHGEVARHRVDISRIR